ncbi:sulfite exporter TauE/SafE family protein, partial [Desulfovibrio sp. OttesenSCG-928-O18]|nr:sulfite exporter TauE/SafE family protein [Desulfovibrio sp. OttesenSCG-928-O18]
LPRASRAAGGVMETVFLVVTTLCVGFVSGCTSVGGVLLIPALLAWTDMDPRTVAGTMLLCFFLSGVYGTFLHYRAGRIDFREAMPMCLGAALFGYAGAITKQYVPVTTVSIMLGVAVILAGYFALRPVSRLGRMADAPAKTRNAGLFAVGAGVAFFCGMTGAGGPVLSVPIMLILGYPALLAVAVARPVQVVLTLSGSIANLMVGAVDFKMALIMCGMLMTGVTVGTYCLRFFKPDFLKTLVSLLCIGTGIFMLVKNFMS